tara:strand:+ start:138 stop:488 length:351 start_codon:yes stop_codon:yes gene_type:complete
MIVDYTNKLLKIYNGAAESFEVLDSLNVIEKASGATGLETFLTNFEVAVAQGVTMFGNPALHVLKGSPHSELWVVRVGAEFEKLTAWDIGQDLLFVLFLTTQSNNNSIKIVAGIVP